MTRYLHPTPTDNLFVLRGIQPTELRCPKAILSLARRSQEPEHLLHKRLVFPSCGYLQRLKSRHPFVPAALKVLNDLTQSGTSGAQWADYKWNMGWQENTPRLYSFIPDVSLVPSRMFFPKPAWSRLNYLRTSVGLLRSTMHKWGMASIAVCKCGAKEQTVEHVIASCPPITIQMKLKFYQLLTRS